MPRPGSQILIVGVHEDEVGVWRFLLRNIHRKASISLYKVDSANNACVAIEKLKAHPFELVMCLEPLEGIQVVIDSLRTHNPIARSLVLTTHGSHLSRYVADSLLTRPSTRELLERIAILLARKRGPRPGSHHRKPPEAVTVESSEAVAV